MEQEGGALVILLTDPRVAGRLELINGVADTAGGPLLAPTAQTPGSFGRFTDR